MGLGNPHEARWRQLAIYHLSLTTRDEWRDGFFTNRADEQFHIVTEDRLPKVINLHVLKEGVALMATQIPPPMATSNSPT